MPTLKFSWPAIAMALLAQPAQAQNCNRLETFTFDGSTVDIVSTAQIAASETPFAGRLPSHCRVDGVVDARTGVGGVSYGIRFALALPDDWNGRFLFQGGGGLNGSVRDPTGNTAAGRNAALARGFAIISTDTGHQGSGFDAGFMADQQAALDFFYAANAKLTPIAKAMIAEHYGSEIEFSYFVGCSTGGREGMIMSQRSPSFFDGIVAGAPAMRTGHSNMSLAYINAAFAEFAPRDQNGVPRITDLFSDSDRALIMDGLLAACDARDGLTDGLIFNTQACDFEPSSLTCSGAKTDACLSAGQVAALDKAFAGPVDAFGRQVYPAFPWDTGLDFAGGGLPGILISGGSSPVQAQRASPDFDVDREAASLRADRLGRTGDSLLPNLSTFQDSGSKLLFFHGMADPWFSANDTRLYYEGLSDYNGGRSAVRSFSRLFLVPDMGHCSGGEAALDNFDLLTALVDWVEHDVAPERVVATGNALPGVSRPLCAYPAYAHYVGGDPDDAASFECRVPE